MREKACPISTPTGPPPRISRRSGSSRAPIASRLVQTPVSSARPSIGGITGEDPVAITIRSLSSRRSPTSTTPRPVIRAEPRTTVTPSSSSARAFALSS